MLRGLTLWNFPAGSLDPVDLAPGSFILSTCQRTMVLAMNHGPLRVHGKLPPHELVTGEVAYLYLLETICGLKSKLIGENEIVGQFKEAYKLYAATTFKDTKLLTILEKLFKDAKDIRTQYLIGISQKTYASLTRRHFQRARALHVVIVGSGMLAEDLINQLKKKVRVSICARNSERVNELAALHKISVIPWENRHELVNESYIANTIGAGEILFDEEFFTSWEKGLFVDLGSPSVVSTTLGVADGVVRLQDIFDEGAVVETQKEQQITLARAAMIAITTKRKSLLEAKLNARQDLQAPQIASDVRYV
jgi:glutamyl-tRNA reductase